MLYIFLALIEGIEAARVGGANLTTCGCAAKTYSPTISVPASYDLRTEYPTSITPIRNQGDCGCCWAFSTSSALADRFSIAAAQRNRTIRRLLSPQTLLDCSVSCLGSGQCNMGCNGGYNALAIGFFNSTGVVGESCRTYQAIQQACPSSPCVSGVNAQRYYSSACYSLNTVGDIQREIMARGSVVAGLQIYKGFESYTSGIFVVSSNITNGGHAVRLIGWGVENGVQYWLAANQWTTWWGENGFFRIRRGTDEAGIESFVIAMTPSLDRLTADEDVDYMTTCADCITTRQQPNSDPISGLHTGIDWPGGLSDTTAISLIILGICVLFTGVMLMYRFTRQRMREKMIRDNEQEMQRAVAESQREHQQQQQQQHHNNNHHHVAVAMPVAARDPELELALALSQVPAEPHRSSHAPKPRVSGAHHLSDAPPPPYPGQQPQRERAASHRAKQQEDAELKMAMALSQQQSDINRNNNQRRLTQEDADLQRALQLSKAEQGRPAGHSHSSNNNNNNRQQDDLALALALSRGEHFENIEG